MGHVFAVLYQRHRLCHPHPVRVPIYFHCHPIENEYRNYPGWQTKIPDDKNGVLELPDYNSGTSKNSKLTNKLEFVEPQASGK